MQAIERSAVWLQEAVLHSLLRRAVLHSPPMMTRQCRISLCREKVSVLHSLLRRAVLHSLPMMMMQC